LPERVKGLVSGAFREYNLTTPSLTKKPHQVFRSRYSVLLCQIYMGLFDWYLASYLV